jgi:two-component system, NtrC family, nitrogen regulation sensor histidine kinase NtrY
MKEKTSSISKYLYAILALITLMAGLGYYLLFEFNSPTALDHYYKTNLQSKIDTEIGLSDADLGKIEKQYNLLNPKSFNQIKVITKYPYFIFKNKKIFYWSDYRFVPGYDKIANIKSAEMLKYNEQFGIFNTKEFRFKNDTIKIVSLINLYRHYKTENDYLQSGYNENLFYPSPKNISPFNFIKAEVISYKKSKPLFYFGQPSKDKVVSSDIPKTTLWIITLAIFLFSLHFLKLIKSYVKKHRFGKMFATVLFYGFCLRVIMLYTGIPFLLIKNDIPNPPFYTGDFFAPTFIDTIINAFFWVVFLTIVAIYYYRSRVFLYVIKASSMLKSILGVLAVISVMLISYYCSVKIQGIYDNSFYKLGLSLTLEFSTFKLLTLFYYIQILGIFFIGSHLAINIFLRTQRSFKSGVLHWLYGFLAGLIIFLFVDSPKFSYLYAGFYFLFIYYFRFSKFFYTLRFQTLLYFISAGFCFALISVEIIHDRETKKITLDKETFGYRYLAENDLLGEGLLDRFSQTVKNDDELIAAFRRPSLALESVKQIVKSEHLDLYFDKYETDVVAFDSSGQNLDLSVSDKNLVYYLDKYQKNINKTDIPSLFFVNETGNNFIKQYISINDIIKDGSKVGTIILDLKLNDDNAESVYPELLMDKKFVQNPESKNYSYGIYDENKKLIFNSGSFNYLMNIKKATFDKLVKSKNGLSFDDYSHLAIKGQNNRTIVVSQLENYWKNLFSNFSFLFLLSILCISLILLTLGIFLGLKDFSINFSTKIQLYLNAAFLLPLIIIIILTLSVVRGTLVSIQEKSFIDNTKNIANTMQVYLDNYVSGKTSRAYLELELNELARNTKVDINYFDNSGKLNFSTRPLVYQYKLLSEYINPLAYNKIVEDKENEILTNESLGTLKYKTVYIALKGNANNKYGVVGIPFFDAKTLLEMQVREVVTTILIIFLSMFILLLLLSFLASNQLTSPLKIIAQRLKKTNLDKLNESIEWKSNDEIGLLTTAYNNMLKKLDESKIALSQSEKQSAWREMAKQVAHEIKNPLTPMKLSIQQLQRTLPMDDPKSRERIQRALNSLTEQIDNISEIANSFSEFAKMPVPRSERFDLVTITQKTTDLYSQNNNVKINFESTEKEMYVLGDRLLISRIVTNLIINGIQSVPPVRQPEISVKIYRNVERDFGIIEVKDNGGGIAESIREKVFIPNFSTKVGGSGLGLAMAKRGIEHGGGNVWFETVEGEGTTFFVDIPIS